MARNRKQFVAAAKADKTSPPAMCLATTRGWADVPARYPDATTAWRNTTDKHTDRKPPAGTFVYWTGGSHGYGHIACSLGPNAKGVYYVRSTDAGGRGKIASVPLPWVESHWRLRYAGWATNCNGVTVKPAPPTAAKKAPEKKSTGWATVRGELLDTLNSKTARDIDESRTAVRAFLVDVRAAIHKLPES